MGFDTPEAMAEAFTADYANMISSIKKYGSKQVTGYSEHWKANNIYDLAGNCYEWTQEVCDINYRAFRGGFCYNSGTPASFRYKDNVSYSFISNIRFSSTSYSNKTT